MSSFNKHGLLHEEVSKFVVPSFDRGERFVGKRVGAVVYELYEDEFRVTLCGFSVCYLRWALVPFGEEVFKMMPPSTEKWGVEGWSYYRRESALNKMVELVQYLNGYDYGSVPK